MKKSFEKLKNLKKELVIAVLGVVLLVAANSLGNNSPDDSTDINVDKINITDEKITTYLYEEAEELRLKNFLGNIKGVGKVDVLLYVDTSTKKVNAGEVEKVEENTKEKDSNGGERENFKSDTHEMYKVIKDKSGNESLVHIYDEYPEIKGVLVSAEGADSNVVKEMIIEAVSSFYDIPVHKVSVMKMNEKK